MYGLQHDWPEKKSVILTFLEIVCALDVRSHSKCNLPFAHLVFGHQLSAIHTLIEHSLSYVRTVSLMVSRLHFKRPH